MREEEEEEEEEEEWVEEDDDRVQWITAKVVPSNQFIEKSLTTGRISVDDEGSRTAYFDPVTALVFLEAGISDTSDGSATVELYLSEGEEGGAEVDEKSLLTGDLSTQDGEEGAGEAVSERLIGTLELRATDLYAADRHIVRARVQGTDYVLKVAVVCTAFVL